MSTGLKANSDGSAAIQVGGTDVITLTSGGAATFVTSPTTVQAGTAAAPSITFSGDTNTGIYSPGADTIAFTEGGVESMRIDSSGQLGIGTSSPLMGLDLRRSGPNLCYGGLDGNTNQFLIRGNLYYDIPNARGQPIVTGWQTQIALDNSNGSIQFSTSTSSVAAGSASTITERARITSGGHFCVGTTAAANTAFQATFFESSNGGIVLQNSTNYSAVSCSSNDVYIDVGRGGTAGSFNVRTSSNNDIRLLISSTGVMTCLGVYNNTVGATNRDVFVDNTGKVGYVASIRASKTNIQNLTDTSWLHQLNPVSFNYRKKDEEGSYTDETDGDIQYGLIAEDVEQVRPDLCFYDEVDGEQELRGIQYSKLVPVMLKALQQQQAMIDELKAKVAALEGA